MTGPAIVVVFETWTSYVTECVAAIERLESGPYPLILVPDVPIPEYSGAARIVVAPGNIPFKRNAGVAACPAAADWIAFVDSDATPRANWITAFHRRRVAEHDAADLAAIAGPGLTPPNESWSRRVCGLALASRLIQGDSAIFYGAPSRIHEVPFASTCCLFVRRSALEMTGGFDVRHPASEDVKICDEIVRAGGRIVFDPEVAVDHHPRDLPRFALQWLNEGLAASRFTGFALKDRWLRFLPAALLAVEIMVILFPAPAPIAVVAIEAMMTLIFFGDAIRRRLSPRDAIGAVAAMWLLVKAHGLGGILGLVGFSECSLRSRRDPA